MVITGKDPTLATMHKGYAVPNFATVGGPKTKISMREGADHIRVSPTINPDVTGIRVPNFVVLTTHEDAMLVTIGTKAGTDGYRTTARA